MTDELHDEMLEEVDFHDELHKHEHDFLGLFETLSLREKLQKVAFGLKQPRDSGAYKYAKLQMIRLTSPFAAVLVPMFALLLLVVFAGMAPPPAREVQVKIMEPESVEDLEEIEELMEEPLEPPEPVDMDFTTPDINITDTTVDAPQTDFSPTPATFESVSIVRSPVIMRGIYGSRSGGARGSALAAYGGSGITEGAVLRALRWLKKNQLPDGSWPKTKPASTSLALLTFLAHGETPASDEFGPTVEKAIKWMVENQDPSGNFKGRDGHNYSQPIAAYAMCEAYALTKVPMVKEAAEKAVMLVIKGQNPSGGFNYNLKPTTRDDTSYMGWCAQSLKAAYMAGLTPPGLQECMKKSIEGFRKNFGGTAEAGGFGYAGPSANHGLTGVGALCMQLLGAPNAKEVKAALVTMDKTTFNWEPKGVHNKNYYWYYITQAKFHAGGSRWKSWNSTFAPVLVRNQTIIKDGIMGPKGEMEDIGWWNMPKELSGHTDGDVMNTSLCALQLQVYYRYLPTFKTPKAIEEVEELVGDDGDVDIQITI